MDVLTIKLPYPPSINNYYRRTSNGVFINAIGKLFRMNTVVLCRDYKNYFDKSKRLDLTIIVNQPDRRDRDLDNLAKSTLDALQHAKVFVSDSQIDKLTIIRDEIVKDGSITVKIAQCK